MWQVLGAVIIWGSMFLVTKVVLDLEGVDPVLFLSVRFSIAFLCFFPILLQARKKYGIGKLNAKARLVPAISGGVCLTAAYLTQAYGILATTVPNAAFLSSVYVLFAPLLTIAILRKAVNKNEWSGALSAIIGTVVLAGFSTDIDYRASILLLACSFFYACQIVAVSGRDKTLPSAIFSGQQMFVVALLTTLVLLIAPFFGRPPSMDALGDWRFILGVLYSGIIGSAIAFWLQTSGQDKVSATQTAIIFALEPVFATALSTLVLNDIPDSAAAFGGLLIVLGVFISLLPADEDASI